MQTVQPKMLFGLLGSQKQKPIKTVLEKKFVFRNVRCCRSTHSRNKTNTDYRTYNREKSYTGLQKNQSLSNPYTLDWGMTFDYLPVVSPVNVPAITKLYRTRCRTTIRFRSYGEERGGIVILPRVEA